MKRSTNVHQHLKEDGLLRLYEWGHIAAGGRKPYRYYGYRLTVPRGDYWLGFAEHDVKPQPVGFVMTRDPSGAESRVFVEKQWPLSAAQLASRIAEHLSEPKCLRRTVRVGKPTVPGSQNERAMARKTMITVLTGSELNGGDQSIAEWSGLEVPAGKWDEYVDLVGGVTPLGEFFETIENGYFEVVDEEDDMGPGMNDTYWEVTTSNVEALRVEIRARLVKELRLQGSAKPRKKPKRVARKAKAGRRAQR